MVTAVSQVVRHGASDAPLRLNGEDLTTVSIHVNDELWTEYKEEGRSGHQSTAGTFYAAYRE